MRVLLSAEKIDFFADLLLKVGSSHRTMEELISIMITSANFVTYQRAINDLILSNIDAPKQAYYSRHSARSRPSRALSNRIYQFFATSLTPPPPPNHHHFPQAGVQILTGCGTEETVLIPWLPLIPTDLPFQLRVALSRVTSRLNLFVLSPPRKALNIVYKEIL
ncbi:hypothetical protein PR048_015997 [Dryococelus australis]|uniref:Uncharacterized protein n=1 Tax=Dryococelus australis TaxID=614101 RepID=A0ABQ9HIW6_9NEOP|nr:hypothetical protein PR048_015997 [Dryococelus australis]